MVKVNDALKEKYSSQSQLDRQQAIQYWQMLVSLPNEVQLQDISTGVYYRRGDLLPLYQHNCRVEVFAIRKSQILNSLHQPLYTESVYAKFLRVVK